MKDGTPNKNKAFLEMYDGFSDELFKFVLSKTRNRDLAMDIVQETFIRTWDYLRSGKTIQMARPFLYKTARNLIIDASRKKPMQSLDALFERDVPYEIPDTAPMSTGQDYDLQVMIGKLRELPEHHFEILTLRFIQELTIPEIATMYGESENTISVRIHRALKQAQKLFPDELYESSI